MSEKEYEMLEQLKRELREYKEKYPDADWNDLIGYIVGFQNREEV